MENKKIGSFIILIGVLFILVLTIFKIQINGLTADLMKMSNGSCFLEDGTCVHEQNLIPIVAGISLAIFTIALGIYLLYFSKAEKSFTEINKQLLSEVKAGKSKSSSDEKFKILMQGLDEDEKKVITAVKDQVGISQSTLKFRTDLSKTKLSVVLSQLEKKSLISKVKKGKINNIYIKKAL